MINTKHLSVTPDVLSEISKQINHNESKFTKLGESIQSIFFVLNDRKALFYLNNIALKWLGISEISENLKIDEYFEQKINFKKNSCVKNSSYELGKVWFPKKSDFKLCLISTYFDKNSNFYLITITPIKEWEYFHSQINNLIENEAYKATNIKKFELLTAREKEIINLIIKGNRSKEISGLLHISKYTVEQHRKNINRKLEIHSLAALVKFGNCFDLDY